MRFAKTLAVAVAAAAFSAGPAHAATSAQGTQAVTGSPDTTLEATFPTAYSFGGFTIGATNTSTEQILNVRSNASWGVKISSDEPTGRMRRYNGSSYVAGQLASALQWAHTRTGATAVGSPVYANLGSTQGLVLGSQGATGNTGTNVGVQYRQDVAYADNANLGTDVYRIAVTFDAAQGF
jgi:hypothetical protein